MINDINVESRNKELEEENEKLKGALKEVKKTIGYSKTYFNIEKKKN